MSDYYSKLPALRLHFSNDAGFEAGRNPEIYEHCEWSTSGNHLMIFQDKIKTFIPLVNVSKIDYPYEIN